MLSNLTWEMLVQKKFGLKTFLLKNILSLLQSNSKTDQEKKSFLKILFFEGTPIP